MKLQMAATLGGEVADIHSSIRRKSFQGTGARVYDEREVDS